MQTGFNRWVPVIISLCCLFNLTDDVLAQAISTVLDDARHHLRNGSEPEWSDFESAPESHELVLEFEARANPDEWCLEVTQNNVKQNWFISINGTKLAALHVNENPIVAFFSIPPDTLMDGVNELRITTTAAVPDDIVVSQIVLHREARSEFLRQTATLVVVEERGKAIPCRITVMREAVLPETDMRQEILMTTGCETSQELAVRPGVIYCTGQARILLPAGTYTLIAGRGPEYGIAETQVTLREGEEQNIRMDLIREVDTSGFVSCDTHVHTFTHSRHGDATIEERMLTLAGEAIELPVATDHNLHIDFVPVAHRMKMLDYFTPVIGNEVTTKIGHFNVFPVDSEQVPLPNFKSETWEEIFASIKSTPSVQAIILNHARDLHSQFRPFDPRNHLASLGRSANGWQLQVNAMEIINSGAQQTDMMRLVDDWMGMLNAGHRLTPVGCSDSHDVARHFVGQARTYIRANDENVGALDTAQAIDNFVNGRVVVSCGLFCTIKVNGEFTSGDMVPSSGEYEVEIDLHGPSWVEADEIELFANGKSVYTKILSPEQRSYAGLKCRATVPLNWPFTNDCFLVAVARGPGVRRLHWPVARPYQPTSPHWLPLCMSVTGAVWIDINGNGLFDAAKQVAMQVRQQCGGDFDSTLAELSRLDQATSLHTWAHWMNYGQPDLTDEQQLRLRRSEPHVRDAYATYMTEWRASQIEAVR
ncbi:MAG: CehA/McbA family metallohydrolase [Planctomycetaceae bacterium]|nr:CehA/McbA family metallohydrolase [Planctomycetaceae bacterium]